jgi:hypothetical protein
VTIGRSVFEEGDVWDCEEGFQAVSDTALRAQIMMGYGGK